MESSSLKKHTKTIHERQRNYQCESCEKSFTLSGYLKTHIKTHVGQRNYNCDSCGKSFTTAGSLKTHIKTIHTDQWNYKLFKSKETLLWKKVLVDRWKIKKSASLKIQFQICRKKIGVTIHILKESKHIQFWSNVICCMSLVIHVRALTNTIRHVFVDRIKTCQNVSSHLFFCRNAKCR